MMKKHCISLYLLLCIYMVWEMVRWKGWNPFYLSILPFAMAGFLLISIALVSGGKEGFVYAFPIPMRMKRLLVALGIHYRRGFGCLYRPLRDG